MKPYTPSPVGCIELDVADFERYTPELVPSDLPLREIAQDYLKICRQEIANLHGQHYNSLHLTGLYSYMMEKLVIFLFEECQKEVVGKLFYTGPLAALCAQGGFGRHEMNAHSDVDLLFLHSQKKGSYIEMLTERILYILWDINLEVGYATRTVSECKKLFLEDTTIMTSLLDLRYLTGEESLVEEVKEEISRMLKSGSLQKKLIKLKIDEKKNRIEKFGGSVFVLEPNVKESAGGLRDLHLPLWIASIQGLEPTFEAFERAGYLSPAEYHSLITARNFLWSTRNDLHLLTGRKTDQLTFDKQETVAQRLGFRGDEGILAVEKFMQNYYNMAYQVSTLTDSLLRRLSPERRGFAGLLRKLKTKSIDENFQLVDGQIAVKKREIFEEEPREMMRAFWHRQTLGVPIQAETKDQIRSLVWKIDEAYRCDPQVTGLFRQMLGNYDNLGDTLGAMHEVRFLEEFMPEFKKLRCRVQHDVYHFYTIDTHSFFAVNELSKLHRGDYQGKFDLYADVLKQVVRPEVLTLGLFLHDIGKGEGGNHSVKGAKLADKITRRLGFSQEDHDTVEFLILSHLMMPHLSQRRDLEDTELVIQFARSMGTMDRLNMLFLLTWGDIRAVGPEAWTDWKGELLEKLYLKGREMITRGEFSKEKTHERITRVKENLVAHLGGRYSREELNQFLSHMPPRYFFAVEDSEIERHFLLHKKAEKEDVVVEFYNRPGQNMTEVLLETFNAPQVFSLMTGIMLAHEVNITMADVFQISDGRLLILLKTTNARGQPLTEAGLLEKIIVSVKSVLFGQLKVDELIAKKQLPDYLMKKPVQRAESRVVVDNDVSAYYTVIDIYTHDRLGLLYDVTRTLSALGCYVEVSKISTKVDQVTDVFYVKDIFGHKITNAEKVRAIKAALRDVVEGKSAAAPAGAPVSIAIS